ncbi:CorA family divalent cation transporter [Thermocatellispora tengchongensis]|uniref:CorA family divalent cation transporter n=1 Tax=Thermocatellispora tengchongensis TaxID=1073253 RepID=UPI00362E0BCE
MAERRGVRSFLRGGGRNDVRREAPERSMDPRAEELGPIQPSVIDNALYVDGRRVATPASLADAFESLKNTPGSMAWIGLYRPKDWEIAKVAEEFGLHDLAVEDAIVAHQRPKADRYGETLFVVLRAARYLDETEEVDFGELHIFLGPNFVITVRHSEAPDLSTVRRRMESDPELLRQGPRRCCTRSWTRSSMATPRWSPACRTTSTRSRCRSSAATRRCRGASTSCPAR